MSQTAEALSARTRPLAGVGFASVVVYAAMFFLLALVVVGILNRLVAPQDPNAIHLGEALGAPSSSHWLGTDELGRDIMSRLIVGARPALVGPAIVAMGAFIVGNIAGLYAGYTGGFWGAAIMRGADLVISLPGLLVAIVLVGLFGGSYLLAVAVLTCFYAPQDARIVRGATLEQRELPYVEAARILGIPRWRIMLEQIWPNVLPLALANALLNFAFALVALSALSFLGLGVPPGDPDWGRMLSDSRFHIFDNAAYAIAPAVMIVGSATSMNLIGDWLYERLASRGRTR